MIVGTVREAEEKEYRVGAVPGGVKALHVSPVLLPPGAEGHDARGAS
jgi:alanine dehydrogenase